MTLVTKKPPVSGAQYSRISETRSFDYSLISCGFELMLFDRDRDALLDPRNFADALL